MSKSIIRLLFVVMFACISSALADTAPTEEINKALLQIANGKQDEVKSKLLDMLVEYPDDAGVQFVLAAVLEDGFKAKDIYEKIIKTYPESEWADDAMWRVLQFTCLVGDTTKARILLQDFKAKYPNSPYVVPATDIVRTTFGIAKGKSGKPTSLSNETAMTEKNIKEVNKEYTEKKEETKKESKSAKEDAKSSKSNSEKKEVTEKKEKSASKEDKMITYGLQVAAYADKATAEKEMRRFLDNRMRAEVKEKKTKDGEILYAVIIGNYSSMETAEYAKKVVKNECKCEPLILEK